MDNSDNNVKMHNGSRTFLGIGSALALGLLAYVGFAPRAKDANEKTTTTVASEVQPTTRQITIIMPESGKLEHAPNAFDTTLPEGSAGGESLKRWQQAIKPIPSLEERLEGINPATGQKR